MPETEDFEKYSYEENQAFAADMEQAKEESLDFASWALNSREEDEGLRKLLIGPSQLAMETTAAIEEAREREMQFQEEFARDISHTSTITREHFNIGR